MVRRFFTSIYHTNNMAFSKKPRSGAEWKTGKKTFGGKKFGNQYPQRGGFGARGSNDFDAPVLHRAMCAKCKQSCEVSFKTNGSKPGFCSNCFKRSDEHASFKPAV